MSKRNYNVFFNTHTVSGIVISVGLFIIFFAGAFSFFREEIHLWQKGEQVVHKRVQDLNVDEIINKLDKEYDLYGRDFRIDFQENKDYVRIILNKTKDSLASEKAKKKHFAYVNIHTLSAKGYSENYDLAEFLYRLHFLDPIIYPIGRYLAGFIAIFFVFAIVTGVIVHWKKIIPNFYSFNPKLMLKRVWTDAHTALGIIGLPFQFMYGITGAFFILSILVLIPANFLYNGNQKKLMEDLRPRLKSYEWVTKSENSPKSINSLLKNGTKQWENFEIKGLNVSNYGGTNMKYTINGELDTKTSFSGFGRITFDAYSGEIFSEKSPYVRNYIEDVQVVWGRLHFATFGGLATKIVYFILAFITCFVIITGVLIWVEARNKKSMTLKQRLYTAKVGHIYLGICLSMLPITALAFIFARLTNGAFEKPQNAIYWFYFVVWGLFTIYYRFKRNNYFTNKNTLLLGAIFGLLVPVINGFSSGNWLFKTLFNGQHQIALIDVLWILLSLTALFIYYKINPQAKMQSAFTKNPIDYKNIKDLKSEEKAKLLTNTIASTDNQPKSTYQNSVEEPQTEIPMRTKIVILWIFLGIGWIVHHIYGLFNVYYNETLMIEGATGEVPMTHHIYRILFEGLCLLFGLLTIEVSKKWFKWTAFIWAIISGLYNVYHFFEAIMHESGNVSEIFMLLVVAIASVFLVKNLWKWIKIPSKSEQNV